VKRADPDPHKSQHSGALGAQNGALWAGLALKNPPKKTTQRNPKKTTLKKPTKNGFYWVFWVFF
jgi:hypothetical protein